MGYPNTEERKWKCYYRIKNLKNFQHALYFWLQNQSIPSIYPAEGLDVGKGSSKIKNFVGEGVERRVGGGGGCSGCKG